ncbi:MAG: hypothetical protein KHX42_04470 [Prevotella sp.]|nr:hypothetical protein [Prevotella sp.]
MRTHYLDSARRLWHEHSAAPLRASDIALYHYIARKTHANGWRMPVFVANGLMCPMLFEKSTLETARKRLVSHGLIECNIPKGNCSCPSYMIKDTSEVKTGNNGQIESKPVSTKAKKEAEEQDKYFLEAMANLWTAFEEEAFNANEIALYAFLLHLAETHRWAMPFRCHDSEIAPVIMRIGALKEAREVLAQRGLISFDLGDPKKTAPKYVILIGDKQSLTIAEKKVTTPSINPLHGTDATIQPANDYLAGFAPQETDRESQKEKGGKL